MTTSFSTFFFLPKVTGEPGVPMGKGFCLMFIGFARTTRVGGSKTFELGGCDGLGGRFKKTSARSISSGVHRKAESITRTVLSASEGFEALI